jgi:hypothetical protein
MLTLRVPDEQYDWLLDRADGFDFDLSATTRDAIEAGRIFYRILGSIDPHAELQKLLDERDRQDAREAYFDDVGRYPDEPAE